MGRRLTKASTLVAILLVASSLASKPTAVAAFNYQDALEKTLLFFEAQRSGKLPADQRVKWRGDSALTDGYDQGVDLVGGYYDAGDHVKFGLPMAYAMTMLSWAMIEFEREIAASNQLSYALEAIKWGTDYLVRAHSQPNTLWAQVGDGDSDHVCWMRAEDMTTPRTAYMINADHPGSDIAGETAAALAAASIAFKPFNSSYSNLLLLHAKQLFSFADTFRGPYDNSLTIVRKYYPSSSGYQDELLWAAAWLFQATNDQSYLKYVNDNAVALGGTGWAVMDFSWDTKYAGVQVLMAKVQMSGGNQAYSAMLKQYQAKAEFFLCSCLQKNNGNNIAMTPGGLLYFDSWSNTQYVSAAAFLLAVYSDHLSMTNSKLNCPDGLHEPSELLTFAQSQADYILGKNPKSMSYLVGYQSYYPTHMHHRGASIPSIFVLPTLVGCTEGFEYFSTSNANPNVLMGALVGGPDQNDQFSDDRSDYEHSEPSLAGNAPLVGLFARLGGAAGTSGYHPKYSPPTSPPASPPGIGDLPKYTPSTSWPSASKITEVPVEFFHIITNSWKHEGKEFYRHQVTVKNKSQKPITSLKLSIENLTGQLWGLSSTGEKNIYEFPPWIKVLNPGSQIVFVYIQEGPQAKVSVVSYY